ncbi:hypothetical protein QA599_14905 [Haloarculaceae archaeon H-GB1-1]|nr:hypothetical protein [Haloarculaceae archaeon H-GB1-1]
METAEVRALLRSQRVNAILAWLLVGLLVAAAVNGVRKGELLWAGFATVVGTLTLLPPFGMRDLEAMLPWEVVLLAGLPVLGRTFATVPVTGQVATYLSVAALALVVTVELQLFTPVEMNVPFAIAFVVIATMATAGLWAVTRWLADAFLGTNFFHVPGLTEAEMERQLMWEFVTSTVAGFLAGIVFEYYVRRFARPAVRISRGGNE